MAARTITRTEGDELRRKVRGVHDVIVDNFYVSERARSGGFEGSNPTVLLSALTAVLDGKALTFGNWGLGKTTIAEAVIALTHGIPTSVTMSSEARGDPEVTKEEYTGRIDLKDMSTVIWQPFALLPPKVLDEFNRLPPLKQGLFLDAIDRGNFEYMNQVLRVAPGPIFATANWPDRGNAELLPAMRDRFDIAITARSMNPLLGAALDLRQFSNGELDDREIAKKMIGVLLENGGVSYEERLARLEDLAGKFRSTISERIGINPITAEERIALNAHIRGIEKTVQGRWFQMFVRAEASCPSCGERMPDANSAHKEGCHYDGENMQYAFSLITNHLSERFYKSLDLYSKALAWYLAPEGAVPAVEPYHMQLALPYAMWHRVGFSQQFQSQQFNLSGISVGNLDLARTASEGILNRFDEQAAELNALQAAFREGNEKAAQQLAAANDHPIYQHSLNLIRGTETGSSG